MEIIAAMRAVFTLIISCIALVSLSQPQAYFDYKVFHAPETGNFLETYLDFSGETLMFLKNKDGLNQAQVKCTIILKDGENIVNFSKKEIFSPAVPDSVIPDFLDIQRIPLKPGSYTLEIELEDLKRELNNKITFQQKVEIPSAASNAYVSDILFLGKSEQATTETPFTRAGLNLYPFVSNYYHEDISKLMFYAEVYNSALTFNDSTGNFMVVYKVVNPINNETFGDYQRIIRKKAAPVIPVLASFDISALPSGKYQLAIEVRNTKNELVSGTKRDFLRSNPKAVISPESISELMLNNSFLRDLSSLDTLQEFLYSLRPLANDNEKTIIDAQKDVLPELIDKKRFFYSFWAGRNATDPSSAWQNYKKDVALVNKLFSTPIKKGYETDRGRVYLQYGPPNTRTERPTEPASYPYEIWHYYHIDKYSNRKFVFYNSDLVTNDYELLHSDMFGEPRNPNWQRFLSKRNNPMDNPDSDKPQRQFGNNADELYSNPR